MAHGKSVEDWRWYVKSKDTGAAVSGPYGSEEQADAAVARMGDSNGNLYVERVNIARLAPHAVPLKQEAVNGKPVPARKR